MCHILSSSFCLSYLLQGEASAGSADVRMKDQILILEGQRQEVSTSQK